MIGLLVPALAQFAPYLISGPALSHIIAQWKIIDDAETPDFVKLGIAFGVALLGTVGANILTGGYAGGAAFGTYAASTLQSAGLLWGTMTIANVTTDKFIPSLATWFSDTVTRIIVAIRKGVDTLLNGGQAPASNTQAA